MLHGKKSKAQNLFYNALESAANKVKVDPVEFLTQAVNNVRPALELKARRVGGANYNVPVPVSPFRQETLVIRWIIAASRKGTGASFDTLLEKELMDAYKGEGTGVKMKEDTERMAEANKAFAHFRW
ncbi:MAG: 30S ribosomal protein S7 [Candidatus Dojkabacteria bacterium]